MLGAQEEFAGLQSCLLLALGWSSPAAFPVSLDFRSHSALHGSTQHQLPRLLSTMIRSQPSRARGRRRRGSLLPKPQLLLREEVSCYGTERTAPEVLLQRSAALCLANNSPGSQTRLSPTSPRTSGVCYAAQTHGPAQYAVSKAGSRRGVPHERGPCDDQ